MYASDNIINGRSNLFRDVHTRRPKMNRQLPRATATRRLTTNLITPSKLTERPLHSTAMHVRTRIEQHLRASRPERVGIPSCDPARAWVHCNRDKVCQQGKNPVPLGSCNSWKVHGRIGSVERGRVSRSQFVKGLQSAHSPKPYLTRCDEECQPTSRTARSKTASVPGLVAA